MATEKRLKPLFALTPEAKKRLEDMTTTIEQAEHSITAMKALGLDTTVLEEKIAWSKKAREILLGEF